MLPNFQLAKKMLHLFDITMFSVSPPQRKTRCPVLHRAAQFDGKDQSVRLPGPVVATSAQPGTKNFPAIKRMKKNLEKK
jgi:hypothetical protein